MTLLSVSYTHLDVYKRQDIYRNEGYMPDARSGNDNGRVQGGSNLSLIHI